MKELPHGRTIHAPSLCNSDFVFDWLTVSLQTKQRGESDKIRQCNATQPPEPYDGGEKNPRGRQGSQLSVCEVAKHEPKSSKDKNRLERRKKKKRGEFEVFLPRSRCMRLRENCMCETISLIVNFFFLNPLMLG